MYVNSESIFIHFIKFDKVYVKKVMLIEDNLQANQAESYAHFWGQMN